MAQFQVKETQSSFYPPRARWYSGFIYRWIQAIRRRFYLDRIHLPEGMPPGAFVLSIVLPGYSFFVLGRRLYGLAFVGAYVLAAIVFVVALGYALGGLAYGLLISIHATSIVYLEGKWLRDSEFLHRLGIALCTLAGVWGLMYAPVVGFAQRHLVMPVRRGERVMVVHCGVNLYTLKRGDWVAYTTPGNQDLDVGGRVIVREGMGLQQVLGLPGDHVRFTKEGVLVGDKLFPLAPYMPVDGELVVPEKTWFIWPQLNIYRGGGFAAGNIEGIMQQMAMVSEKQIIGRPFRHWFGRRQWP